LEKVQKIAPQICRRDAMGILTSLYLFNEELDRLRVEPNRSISATIKQIVDRYQYLIDVESKILRILFSETEWDSMLSATRSTTWRTAEIILGEVFADVEDSIGEGSDKEKLIGKLLRLTTLQEFALVEMLEEDRDENL